jgi:low temperature requirement protein LtrA
LTGDFSAGFTIAREAGLTAVFDAVLALVFAATFGAALLAFLLVDDFTATVFPFGLALTAVDLAAGFAALLAEVDFTGADLVVFAEAVCFLAGFFIAVAMASSTTE